MSYRFHPVALEQQESIWFYTLRTWGEEQADRYIIELHRFIEKLCGDPTSPPPKKVPIEFVHPVYVRRYRHHYVYFRWAVEVTNELLVLSILHESMDLPTRLREVLSQIESGGT